MQSLQVCRWQYFIKIRQISRSRNNSTSWWQQIFGVNETKCRQIQKGFKLSLFGRKHNENTVFNLDGIKISYEDELRLLDITIDFKLYFNTHISDIYQKASRQLNVLKRVGKRLSKLGKITIYHSFIMSNFSYCPLTWQLCTEQNARKFERIQERALRFIYDDYKSTYEHLLKQSKVPSIKTRKMQK
jgi:hypothetical protein